MCILPSFCTSNSIVLVLVGILSIRMTNGQPLVPALFIFGDSVVDAGNNNHLYTVIKSNFPPYGRDFIKHEPTGRFCNGKLASDFTAENLGFTSYPPAYLSKEASGNNLLIGANFASGGSGYYENTAKLYKSEMAMMEMNRAAVVAMNAEIRRMKARLLDEVPKLQKLSKKKVKGLSKEELETRNDMVLALPERIQAIPDGATVDKKNGVWGSSTSNKKIKFDSDGNFGSEYFQETEESSQFRSEYEMRKMKQDEGLDIISEGLDMLKNLAHDMNEELDRQVPLIDEIDTKVDRATTDIKNTNVRLKETINRVRSSRNFIIDIILLCIILGIASYLYNILS